MTKYTKVPSIKAENEFKNRVESILGVEMEDFGEEMKQRFKEFKKNLTPEQIEAIKNSTNGGD